MKKLPIRPQLPRPRLSYTRILDWADEFHELRGRWPKSDDGVVSRLAEENWNAIDHALSVGLRGLPGGTTLAKLLYERRGRPHYFIKPTIKIEQILAWADAHHKRAGEWPKYLDGRIPNTALTWSAVHTALVRGTWGLPEGGSLARLLEEHRSVKNHLSAPPLTPQLILKWADDNKKKTGHYPKHNHGQILAAPRETWCAIENALRVGNRGLPSGDSLAKFLTRHRGLRNRWYLPPLTIGEIKVWALAFKRRMGTWPTAHSGPIPESNGETWAAIHGALYSGLRGLPGGDTLARVLARECGRKNPRDIPPLKLKQIEAWILRHHELTGKWPRALSGPVLQVENETWCSVANAMQKGTRSMSGRKTLAQLVEKCRGSNTRLMRSTSPK